MISRPEGFRLVRRQSHRVNRMGRAVQAAREISMGILLVASFYNEYAEVCTVVSKNGGFRFSVPPKTPEELHI